MVCSYSWTRQGANFHTDAVSGCMINVYEGDDRADGSRLKHLPYMRTRMHGGVNGYPGQGGGLAGLLSGST